jgi:hyaluronoglucosaminidase
MRRAALVSPLALTMILTVAGWSPPQTPQAAPAGRQLRAPGAVYPRPQQTRLRDDFVTLTPVVTLVTGDTTDASAVTVTKRALKAAGVRRIVTTTDPRPGHPERLTVRLQDDAGNGLPAEGYLLTLAGGSRRSAGHIVLAGVDGTGAYYAAQSLRQILPRVSHPGTRVRGLSVRDWPATRRRGVIQGFYGTAWSQRAQLDQLDYYGAHKMDTYVYSPKDDPYLRARWRDPYPTAQLADLKELVDRAEARHVTFTYALSPGLSVCYSSQDDAKALEAKFASMWRIGVRSFVIPLDDISYTKWNCPEDEKEFGTGGAAAGKAQAHLVNEIDADFVHTHPGAAPLQMVPTEYAGTSASPYKKVISEQLASDVIVQWTGKEVVSPSVSAADARAAHEVFGHPVLLWDNYPVNDYATDRLLLGPYTGRDKGLPQQVAGILANPMIQPFASKIALGTVADYTWNPGAYDPAAAWSATIKELAGGDREVQRALRAFADVNHSSVIDARQGPDLSGGIRDFWHDGDAAALGAAFDHLEQAPAVLEKKLPAEQGADGRGFVDDCRPWLAATRDWAHAAHTALRMLTAARAGDDDEAWRLRRSLPDQLARAESHRYVDEDGKRIPAVVGQGVLNTFVDDALAAHDVLLGRTPRPKASTDMGTHQYHFPDRMTDGDDGTWYWNKGPAEKDDYVQLDLRGTRTLGKVTLEMGAPGAEGDVIEQGVLEYSADGEHWTPFASFSSGHQEVTATAPAGTRARYVRARATADQDALVAVRSFEVAPAGSSAR